MTAAVLRDFVTRIAERRFDDVGVTYRVVGGMPSQRIDYVVELDPASGARVSAYDARRTDAPVEASIPGDQLDAAGLVERLSSGIHTLHERSEQTVLPDATIGSLTIRVGGDETTLYFVPEHQSDATPGRGVTPALGSALQQLWDLATRTVDAKGRRD